MTREREREHETEREWPAVERRRTDRRPEGDAMPIVNVYPQISIAAPKWTLSHVLAVVALLGALGGFLMQNAARLASLEATVQELSRLMHNHMRMSESHAPARAVPQALPQALSQHPAQYPAQHPAQYPQ